MPLAPGKSESCEIIIKMIKNSGRIIIFLFILCVVAKSFWVIHFDASKASWQLILFSSILVALVVPISIDISGIFRLKSQTDGIKRDIENIKNSIHILTKNEQNNHLTVNIDSKDKTLPQGDFGETSSLSTSPSRSIAVENQKNK